MPNKPKSREQLRKEIDTSVSIIEREAGQVVDFHNCWQSIVTQLTKLLCEGGVGLVERVLPDFSLHPMVKPISSGKYQFHSPFKVEFGLGGMTFHCFDETQAPIARRFWLDQIIVVADGQELTIADALRFPRNKEAAHSDPKEHTKVAALKKSLTFVSAAAEISLFCVLPAVIGTYVARRVQIVLAHDDVRRTSETVASAAGDVLADALYERGQANVRLGNREEAIRDFTRVIVMDCAGPLARAGSLNARGFFRRQSADLNGAIDDFGALMQIDGVPPDMLANTLMNRGYTLVEQGDLKAAILDFTAALGFATGDQKATGLLNRGVVYERSGDLDLAIDDYLQTSVTDNTSTSKRASAMFNLGLAYQQLGNHQRAIRCYSAIVEMRDVPADLQFDAILNRGHSKSKQGDLKDAVADFTTVIDCAGMPMQRRMLALSRRATVSGQLGAYDDSIRDCSAVLKMPEVSVEDRIKALHTRAVARRRLGDGERANADTQEIRQIDPSGAVCSKLDLLMQPTRAT